MRGTETAGPRSAAPLVRLFEGRTVALDRVDPRHHAAHHLDENLGAASVRFTPEELSEFRAAFATMEIRGARAPESAAMDL